MNFKNKKVLVAGGSGFVGTNLIKRLLDLGSIVTSTVHKSPVFNKKISNIHVDLTNKEDCKNVCIGHDYVFMCAANTSGAAVMEKTPLAHVTPNVIMNTYMLEAAYKSNVDKFIFISSNTVYPVTDYPVKEEEAYGDLFEKYFCVGWMKRFTEILCQMYSQKIKDSMKTVVVRPGNIYGPFDDFNPETSHVVAALIKKIVEGQEPLEVWGDGNDIKDLIYIDDFIDGLLLAADKIDSFDPINIATGKPSTIRDIIKYTYKAMGEDAEKANIIFDLSKPSMIPIRLINVDRAKDILNFQANISLEEGIKKTVEWYSKK